MMRLDTPLGSYPYCDEFQVGRILVFVGYDSRTKRTTQLLLAEKRLVSLESDIPNVECLVTAHVGSPVNASVIGIRIEPDGTAAYDCTFFDGEFKDHFVHVSRGMFGELTVDPACYKRA